MSSNILVCLCAAGLLLFGLFGCQYSAKIKNQQAFSQQIPAFRRAFETKNPDRLRTVCTSRGYSGIVEWTDSLKDRQLMDAIAQTLSSKHMLFSAKNDSTFVVMIRKGIAINEDPVGDLIVSVRNHTAKIDDYAGGIRTH